MLISGFLIFFFAFFLLFGIAGLRSHRHLQRVGIKTMATVVGIEKVEKSENNATSFSYYPKVEFRTNKGETIVRKTNPNRRKRVLEQMIQEKAQVPIIYDPSKPDKFSTDSRSQEIIPLVLCIVGIIGVTFGLFGLLGIIDMPLLQDDYWGP